MLPLLFALCLSFTLPLEDAPPAPPDPVRVKAVVTEIEKAFKSGDMAARVQAIEAGAPLVDAEVIDRIAKGLRDKESDVQKAAIEALRGMDHPSAVKGLEEGLKREPRLVKDVELHALALRALGQHGRPSSIDLLTDDFWSDLDQRLMQARILGLGRIRTKASVEKLIDLMKMRGPHKIQAQMQLFRTSLIVLTGADQGASQEGWMKWWNDNKAKLEVAAKPAALPKQLQNQWDAYWNEGKAAERAERRGGGKKDGGKEDPGKDGEKDTGGNDTEK